MSVELELDDGWVITTFESGDMTWHGVIHKPCQPQLNEHSLNILHGKGFICAKCKIKVPDEVIGFHALCNWSRE